MLVEKDRKFLQIRECEYFPCHKKSADYEFSCLFCYCPLYSLGDKCGGVFKYKENGNVKSCIDCELPHMPEYYDTIVEKLKEKRKGDGKNLSK